MGTFLHDLCVASWDAAASIALDALGLPARPLTVAAVYSGWPLLEPFLNESLPTGLIWLSAAVLLGISCGALLDGIRGTRCVTEIARFIVLVFALDGTLQLPGIVAPPGSGLHQLLGPNLVHFIASYPVSHSGVFAVTCQLWSWLLVFEPWTLNCWHPVMARLGVLLFSSSLRFMSIAAVPAGSLVSDILYALSCCLALGSLILWDGCLRRLSECCSALPWERVCKRLSEYVRGLCSFLALALPRVRDCLRSAMHRLLSSWLLALLQPVWYRFHTLVMPAVMACVALACHRDVLRRWGAYRPGLDQSLELATNAFCGGAATVSVFILGIHGIVRVWSPGSEPNPLQATCLLIFLESSAWVISLPWRALRSVGDLLVAPVVRRLVHHAGPFLYRAQLFAEVRPLCAIPVVLLASCGLTVLLQSLGDLARLLPERLPIADTLHADFKGPVTDSSFAMLLIASVQVTIYTMVDSCLAKLRQVRRTPTLESVDAEERQNLAATMQDPRQCPSCGFGPVDYAGCADLRAHHQEHRRSGAYTNNSCPGCGYFSPSLDSWPPFDGDMQTPAGQSMLCQRKWNEVVVIVRAVSKALLLTYCPMYLGRTMGLPPTWRVISAVSYLAAWACHNTASLGPLLQGEELGNIRGRRQRHRQQQRQQGALDPEHGGAACGAPAAAEPLLPRVTQSEALQNILANRPARIYLRPEDPCVICRREFAEASDVLHAAGSTSSDDVGAPVARSRRWLGRIGSSGLSVEDACQRLQNLPEPAVAMRCGHVLHLDCAEACIAHAAQESNGHVRCPQCRQPVTVSAETAAVFFS
ncbi:unnamed protein product [Prorocentrum cordatum]|uniref:RING-type domain-containing protein n=1 Tax=Prorocentrum cordatum TaxID=2364126 RepID=A0ABN9QCG4_9DINO|nr:unnamed protein product [Polarella glacialis]